MFHSQQFPAVVDPQQMLAARIPVPRDLVRHAASRGGAEPEPRGVAGRGPRDGAGWGGPTATCLQRKAQKMCEVLQQWVVR